MTEARDAGKRWSGQELADQAGACMVLKAFLKKQALRTSNLRTATSYAEAAAIIDAYLEALTAVQGPGGLLEELATLRAEHDRLRAENERQAEEIARLREQLTRAMLDHSASIGWWEAETRRQAKAAESQVQALQQALEKLIEQLATEAERMQKLSTEPEDGEDMAAGAYINAQHWLHRILHPAALAPGEAAPKARDAGVLECDQCGAKPDTWGPEWAGWTAEHGEGAHCPMDKIHGCDGLMRRVAAPKETRG